MLVYLFKFSLEPKIKLALPFRTTRERVEELRPELSVSFTEKIPFLRKVADRIAARIEVDVLHAGMAFDSYVFAAKYSFYSLFTTVILAPVSFLAAVAINPMLLCLLTIRATLLYTRLIELEDMLLERKTSTEESW